jgi:hypothetical protein
LPACSPIVYVSLFYLNYNIYEFFFLKVSQSFFVSLGLCKKMEWTTLQKAACRFDKTFWFPFFGEELLVI